MAKSYGQKLKILYVLDILRTFSDEDNPISAVEICKALEQKGIFAERKSVYDDISLLSEYGYDIVRAKRGFFLASREFEEPEIHLLCDAVRSANFITAKKSRELVRKLTSNLSQNQIKQSEKNIFFDSAIKCTNEQIYYNIDKLSRAISECKQVRLEYRVRGLSPNRTLEQSIKTMVINPYALCWEEDHYYLIGNYVKYDNLIHLRVDRIYSVEILNSTARHFSEVSSYTDAFDIADYTKRLFGMHGGKQAEIELCCNKKITEQVIDRFSENIFITKVTEQTFNFSVNAILSEALVTWLIGFGQNITVVKPQELKNMLIQRAEKVLDLYKTE